MTRSVGARAVHGGVAIGLLGATLWVYAGLGQHEFIAFDTPNYVLDNPPVRGGLSWGGVVWAFTTPYMANWHPLTWLSHMLDCSLFGVDAGAHHLVSLAIHTANALLLYAVMVGMTGACGRSAFVAGVFALHPLHVESVAWVAERKDLLSAFFWIIAMGAWGRYARVPSRVRYAAASACYVAALLSKPMAVTFPLALLILDVWPLGRCQLGRRHLVGEKLALFGLSAVVAIVTLFVQRAGGAMADPLRPDVGVAHALTSYVRYVAKTFWPTNLAVFYPYERELDTLEVIAAGSAVVLFTSWSLRRAHERPWLLSGWLWFLVTLLPVIGLIQAGPQAMADRYTYLPLIGLSWAVAWGFHDLAGRLPFGRRVVPVLGAAALVALALAARGQVRWWVDTPTLFGRALEVTRDNWMAHNLVGYDLYVRGETEAALVHFSEAVRINPKHWRARLNLGSSLSAIGRLDEAETHLALAAELAPEGPDVLLAQALNHERAGRPVLAHAAYERALEIDPGNAPGNRRLGVLLVRRGDPVAGEQHLRTSLESDPQSALALMWLAIAMDRQGRLEEALAHYRRALERAREVGAESLVHRIEERLARPGDDALD